MDPVYVIGTSMTRFGPFPDAGVKSLTAEAVRGVLADAAVPAAAIEAVFFANATQGVVEGQVSTRGQFALHHAGITGVPVVNAENACASAATAFWLACAQVRSGGADTVLAIGAEKMVYPDPERNDRVFDCFLGALDVEARQESLDRVLALGGDVAGHSGAGRRTVMMDLYAGLCRAHMNRFGSTREQLALIAAKNHGHAALNDKCHFDRPMSPEQVLAGRPLAFPLTVPMCAPISDGAAAALVCNRAGLDRLTRAVRSRAVRVRACELRSATDRAWDDFDRHVVRRAALAAYERAGVRPEQVGLAEVHDAASFGELFATELLGLAPLGGGGKLAESGDTRLGGAVPVNPSGGLESRGHPIGATGLAQIHELVTQLRGEAGTRQVAGATVGIQENGGAFLGVEEAAAVVTILSPHA
jgi:acetyl-CoA acetyltransferase